jgi:hypothetical protein
VGSASLCRKVAKVVPTPTEYARTGGRIRLVTGAHLAAYLPEETGSNSPSAEQRPLGGTTSGVAFPTTNLGGRRSNRSGRAIVGLQEPQHLDLTLVDIIGTDRPLRTNWCTASAMSARRGLHIDAIAHGASVG